MGNARGMKPVRLSGRLCVPCGHEKYGIIALARNRQAPGCVRIRVCWVSPPTRPLPLQRPAPLRAISFAQTCPQRSRLPIPPKAVRAGLHFSQLSAASPGHVFAPLSATGQGLGQEGRTPEKYICFDKCAGMHSGVSAFTPEPRAPPRLRQNFYKGTCLSGTWSMFVLLTSTTPRSFYFA